MLYLKIGDLATSAMPERLSAIGYLDALEGQAVYLAKGFRRIDEAVKEPQIAAVPERCAIGRREITVAAGGVLALPDDVHAFETTFDGFDTTRLFESRLTFTNSNALEAQVAALVKRAFAGEILVRDLHFLIHKGNDYFFSQ